MSLSFKQQLRFFYQTKTLSARICPYKNNIYSQEESDLHPDVQIYTDGSRVDKGTGYAYQGGNIIYTSTVKLNIENSIYQAELSAILDAIK